MESYEAKFERTRVQYRASVVKAKEGRHCAILIDPPKPPKQQQQQKKKKF